MNAVVRYQVLLCATNLGRWVYTFFGIIAFAITILELGFVHSASLHYFSRYEFARPFVWGVAVVGGCDLCLVGCARCAGVR